MLSRKHFFSVDTWIRRILIPIIVTLLCTLKLYFAHSGKINT